MVQTEVRILRELLASESGFVSGTRLAQDLGMSRVSVWSHMEKMRAEGFVFEAVRRIGYRLAQAPATLHPWMVAARVASRHPLEIVWRETVDSTNSEAERELAAGRNAPFAVLARSQTAGRGRMGRRWESEDTGNLYVSFAFRPRLEPAEIQTFTLWMGLNVCACVANVCRIRPQVKWPNDILHRDRKLGGMLTEARIDADHTRDLIFGLGLNVNTDTRRWPDEVRQRATSLRDVSGGEVDLNHLAASVIARVVAACDQFLAGEHRAVLSQLWQAHDALDGREITVRHGNRTLHGRACGITPDGALQLRLADGSVEPLRAGEVTIGAIS